MPVAIALVAAALIAAHSAAMPAATPVATLAAAPNPFAIPARCQADYGLRHAAAAADAQPKRLDRLPRANLVLALYREIDRCPAPIIVRADIGGRPAAPAKQADQQPQ